MGLIGRQAARKPRRCDQDLRELYRADIPEISLIHQETATRREINIEHKVAMPVQLNPRRRKFGKFASGLSVRSSFASGFLYFAGILNS